ncbi:MAG TPA: ATP-binding protein [Pyrinomonadaceae bacterium]|nr:ATP-binding protein [Pyrinomonadaceae bacterium]
MNLRTRILLVFVALALAPLAAASLVGYRGAVSSVEAALRERADERVALAAGTIEGALKRHERALLVLAQSGPTGELVSRAPAAGADGAAKVEVPEAVVRDLESFLKNGDGQLESVAVLGGPDHAPLARSVSRDGSVATQTADFISGAVRYDQKVWALGGPSVLRSQVTPEAEGSVVRLTAPVFVGGVAGRPAGALVREVKARALLAAAEGARSLAGVEGAARAASRQALFAVENSTGLLVYHSNSALNHQPVADAMPSCAAAAERMRAGESGSDFYEEPGAGRRLVSYGQAPGLNLSLAAAEDYTAAVAPARGAALWSGGLALAAGLAGLALLFIFARRAERGFQRVAQGAAAIAGGRLDQRIEVDDASGEIHALAETLNEMGTQLREMMAREAESKQLTTFMRVSAMISHDLKNAIAGLSMLVSNMERQFHREEFRADAIESLREATDKLKRTVARLSEPVRSLSGEYRRDARPTDLVPVIRRVLAARAEPARPLYEVEAHLPDALVATVEPERVEAVVENLVVNALEAMGAKGGRLTVEARQEGDYVHLSVADTGVGMTEEFIRTRLFHPFATTKTKGIGLGLFTCKEVVEAHGGKLEVESRLGAGTRFRVVLPSRLFKAGDRQQRPAKGAD